MKLPKPHLAEVDELLALQQRFHDGDVDAFRRLAEPHLDQIYTLCLRMTGSHAEGEDVAQDALARALERCHLYLPGRPFRPWMLTIAANMCRSRMRSAWWRRWNPLSGFERSRSAPDAEVQGRDSDAKVRAALATLEPKYREAIALFHLDGMGYAEMSEITDTSVPALKQRVRRGLPMLRNAIEQMYPGLVVVRMDDNE